jgi:3-deoxy-D-manno-octulosonic-acid transferase
LKVIYTFFIFVFEGLIRLAGIFSPKANEMIQGRKFQVDLINKLPKKTNQRIWIHAASLGEYEMSIPLIEEISKNLPKAEFIISFFSPSGYKNAKLLSNCTKFYLPFDSIKNANKWIHEINPDIAIFVKYEFWPNLINACHQKNIPLWYWNFLLRDNHFILKPWASFWQNALKKCAGFFSQNENTVELAKSIDLPNTKLLGDIRYLRTKNIQSQLTDVPQNIKDFTHGKNTLILGSSWEAEENGLLKYLQNQTLKENQCIIIAPHDISKNHIDQIQQKFNQFGAERFSNFANKTSTKILIIDSIGLLSRLYAFSNLAVIGGAFGKGLHNIIEATAAGVPVIFGPNTAKFPEAKEFVHAKIGFQVNTIDELAKTIDGIFNSLELKLLKQKTKAHFDTCIPEIEIAVNEILRIK